MNKITTIFFVLVFCINVHLLAQEENTNTIPKQTELIIPPSPAYQMLDATSSLVNAPGAIRDFKVDWSFKTYRLAPNLAIEAQPIWSIFYNRPSLNRYQNAGKFLQTLSTLSLSAGSLDANDTIRLFAWAGKLTLYRGFDPLANNDWFKDIVADYEVQQNEIETRIVITKQKFQKATHRFEKDSLQLLLSQTREELDQLKTTQKQKIKERQESIKARYWNRSAIDVAYGRSYSFNRGITERIDSVKFKEEAISVWLNGSFGIGRYVLVTGLIRTEQLNFVEPDSGQLTLTDIFVDPFSGDTTFEERDSLFVNFNEGKQNILSLGLNIRFGSPRYNFFMECFYTKSRTPSFKEVKWESGDDYYGTGSTDVSKRKKSILQEEILVAFGGEWRASRNVILSYGIRSTVDKNFKFRNIIPLASISCLMR